MRKRISKTSQLIKVYYYEVNTKQSKGNYKYLKLKMKHQMKMKFETKRASKPKHCANCKLDEILNVNEQGFISKNIKQYTRIIYNHIFCRRESSLSTHTHTWGESVRNCYMHAFRES